MLAASIAGTAINAPAAHAAPEYLSLRPTKVGKPVAGNDWYYIRVKCHPARKKFPDNSRRTMAVRIDHTKQPEEPESFPHSAASSTGLMTIYAAKTKNTPAVKPSGRCDTVFMVKGEDNPSLTVFVTHRRIEWEKYADQALAIVGAIITLYSPFYKSIKFKDPKSGRGKSLEGSKEAITQLQALNKAVAVLSVGNGNQRDHERLAGRNMREGTYWFTNEYANLEVTVGKYNSMLLGPGKFREAISKILNERVKEQKELFEITSWDDKQFLQNCRTLKANFDEAGIKNKVDQGYVIFYSFLLETGGATKEVASCMGETMARLYVEQPDQNGKKQPSPWRLLHDRIPSARPITKELVDGIFGEKPVNNFNKIADAVAHVAQATAVRGKPGYVENQVYKTRSTEKIKFVDLTGRVVDHGNVEELSLGDAIAKMGRKGFKRYGYIALLPDEYEYPLGDLFKTRTTMLAFQQEPEEQLYKHRAILMRLLFNGQKISGIVLSQGEDLKAALRNDRAKEIPTKENQKIADAS